MKPAGKISVRPDGGHGRPAARLRLRGIRFSRRLRVGPLVFRDPLPTCMVLYLLLYFDSSHFLRIGLLAACLHECGHILVYCLLRRRLPVIEVTGTGFCMKTRGCAWTAGQLFCLAAAGPLTNAVLAALWWAKLARRVTLWDDAFFAANLLTGAFNLLPVPPLDGAQMLAALRAVWQGRGQAK